MKQVLPQQIFITGVGTGVGKTVASAVLCQALQADYWKPVQCGNLDDNDTLHVKSLVSNSASQFHPESFRLKEPASPHYAAHLENLRIEMDDIHLPATNNRLLIEGAGGILVPLNDELVMFDLVERFELPVIVVVRNYLGSINHTLLTTEFLEARGVTVLGMVVSGENFNDNQDIVQHLSQIPVIGRIDEAADINAEFIFQQAEKLKLSLSLHFKW